MLVARGRERPQGCEKGVARGTAARDFGEGGEGDCNAWYRSARSGQEGEETTRIRTLDALGDHAPLLARTRAK